jgi:4-hydroxy-3-methylbut-2-enyl diphosphate reductase
VVEEERKRRRTACWESITEGQAVNGIVRRLTDFGAFVDVGGVDGLLHVSEISWTHIKHPSESLKVGDRIQVVVLKVDKENQKISLGLKQLLPDPWKEAIRGYRLNKMVRGEVVRLSPNGAFVRFEDGVEGIIPKVELTERHIASPEEVVRVGDVVDVKVLQVVPKQRRLMLSLRQAEQELERQEYRDYMKRQKPGSVTLRDLYGDLLNNVGDGKERSTEERAGAKTSEETSDESDPSDVSEPSC